MYDVYFENLIISVLWSDIDTKTKKTKLLNTGSVKYNTTGIESFILIAEYTFLLTNRIYMFNVINEIPLAKICCDLMNKIIKIK